MKLLIPFLVVALSGCAGTTTQTTTSYLLRAGTESGTTHLTGAAEVGIGTLAIAPYIDRLGLVIAATDGEVSAARHHVWAEPLRDSLRQYLGAAISRISGVAIDWLPTADQNWQQRIDIRIDQLHGSANGEAVLVAYWSVRDIDSGDIISRHSFNDSQAQSNDGYGAMVEAESVLLDRLAESISESLSTSNE